MRALSLTLIGLCVCAAVAVAAGQSPQPGAPETFSTKAQAENSSGAAVSAPIQIHIERYTPDFDRKTVEEALRIGGYPGFLPALRKAPDVGYVELAGQKYTIRWARLTTSETGRTIVVVTDRPVAFIGGGQAAHTSRAGYEVALVRLDVDGKGSGTGTMAAAARVKPDGSGGVVLDDYAEVPITLTAVTRR